jgi:hypothetical protein
LDAVVAEVAVAEVVEVAEVAEALVGERYIVLGCLQDFLFLQGI